MADQRALIQNAPLGRVLWALSWPLVVASEIEQVMTTILIFWIGRMIGSNGLAVESLFRPVALVGGWLLMAPAIGGAVLVSRSVGARDGKGLAVIGSTLTLTLVLVAGIAVITVPCAPMLASWLSGADSTAMLEYLLAFVLLAMPTMALINLVIGAIEASGHTRFGLMRSLVDLGVIAALAPLTLWAFGVAGAPVAAGIGSLGLLAALLWTILRRRGDLELGQAPARFLHVDRAIWRDAFGIGLPVVGIRMTNFVVQMMMLHAIGRQDPRAAAGFGLAMMFILYCASMTKAVGQAGGIIIGQSLGAKRLDRARQTLPITLSIGVLVTSAFVVFTTACEPVLRFLANSSEIAANASHALSIMRWGAFGIAFWQISLAALTAHKRSGKAGVYSALIDAVGWCVFVEWPGDSRLVAAAWTFCVIHGLKTVLYIALWSFRSSTPRAGGATSR